MPPIIPPFVILRVGDTDRKSRETKHGKTTVRKRRSIATTATMMVGKSTAITTMTSVFTTKITTTMKPTSIPATTPTTPTTTLIFTMTTKTRTREQVDHLWWP